MVYSSDEEVAIWLAIGPVTTISFLFILLSSATPLSLSLPRVKEEVMTVKVPGPFEGTDGTFCLPLFQ